MDSVQIQFVMEKKFLQCIVDLSKSNKVDDAQIKIAAKVMQAMRPWNNWSEAELKSEFFVSKFPNFGPMFDYAKSMKMEEETTQKIELMHKHLKEDNIDAALQIAKEN
ncbi:MAG: hypothetical protein U0525_02320 [Patescibacteria group bacterium]